MNPLNEPQESVLLPRSVEALDEFVANLVEDYELPPGDDTYEIIASLIMHMDPKCAYAPRKFFVDSIYKSMANNAAYIKLKEFDDKRRARKEAEAQNKKEDTIKNSPEGSNDNVIPLQN